MPKGAKKRAKLKKKQQVGHPAGSNGAGKDSNGSNNSSRHDASDGSHLPVRLNIPSVDLSEDSMGSSEDRTPRAQAYQEEDKAASSEVPVERTVEEDCTGDAREEVIVIDALPSKSDEPEHEVHALVQESEVQDVVVSEAPEVLEPEVKSEDVAVRETAKVHPVHEPEPKGEEVAVRETATAPVLQESEAKGDGAVARDLAEVSRSPEAAGAHTTEVVRGPAVAVAAAEHRATWWNCCGIFDAFAGSER